MDITIQILILIKVYKSLKIRTNPQYDVKQINEKGNEK